MEKIQSLITIGDYFASQLENLTEELLNAGSGARSPGICSGFARLDEFGGLSKGELVVVAGRPGMGTKSFILNLARNIAGCEQSQPVLIVVPELSLANMIMRLVTIHAEIESKQTRHRMEKQEKDLLACQIKTATKNLQKMPIFIDDQFFMDFPANLSRSAAFVKEKGIKVILIDSQELLSSEATGLISRRDEKTPSIPEILKSFAVEHDVAIICSCSLSRAVEHRSCREPRLRDLIAHFSLEQSSDMVLLLYRDSYYNPLNEESKSLLEVHVSKNRNGFIGCFSLVWHSGNGLITNTA